MKDINGLGLKEIKAALSNSEKNFSFAIHCNLLPKLAEIFYSSKITENNKLTEEYMEIFGVFKTKFDAFFSEVSDFYALSKNNATQINSSENLQFAQQEEQA